MFFSGSTQQRKVSLGGRSRGEETREQTLERTRAEREKRQRSKLENKSAVIIASAWRQRAAAIRVQNDLRQSWVHLCRGSQDSRCAGWIFCVKTVARSMRTPPDTRVFSCMQASPAAAVCRGQQGTPWSAVLL